MQTTQNIQHTNNLNIMPRKFNFVGLPAEIRVMIYTLIFYDIWIKIDLDKFPGILTRSGQNHPYPQSFYHQIPLEEMIHFVIPTEKHRVALLRASSFMYEDAIAVLAANAILEYPCRTTNEEVHARLTMVPPSFLKHVRKLHISPDFLLGSNLTLLPRLKHVTLRAWLKPGMSLANVIHIITCFRCSSYENMAGLPFYDTVWRNVQIDIPNEPNKGGYFMKLATKNRWTLDLIIDCETFHGRRSKEWYIRFHFYHYDELRRLGLYGKWLLRHGEVPPEQGLKLNHETMLEAVNLVSQRSNASRG